MASRNSCPEPLSREENKGRSNDCILERRDSTQLAIMSISQFFCLFVSGIGWSAMNRDFHSMMALSKEGSEFKELGLTKFLVKRQLDIPIISTTLTTFGNRALSFFKELGSLIRKLTDEPREGFFLRQRLAIAIHRANYISFIGSLISHDD
ncbi:unnamed protein product [Gordionus sp. m RMFG-2023]